MSGPVSAEPVLARRSLQGGGGEWIVGSGGEQRIDIVDGAAANLNLFLVNQLGE